MVPKSLPARFPTWTRFAEDTIYFVEVCRLGKVVLVKDFLTAVRYHSASQSAGPDIAAQWHQTFEEWLQRNPEYLDRDRLNTLRRQMLGRLVHQTFKAHYKHHAGNSDCSCNYLALCRDPAVQPLLDGRIPPYWFYTLHRGLGKLRGLWQGLWMSGKPNGWSHQPQCPRWQTFEDGTGSGPFPSLQIHSEDRVREIHNHSPETARR